MVTVLAVGLALLLVVSGITHVTAPSYYRGLVPSWLPAPEAVVLVSGGLDVVVGVLLAVPNTRGVGGWAAAALITAYLPAHLDRLRSARTAARRFDRLPAVLASIAVNSGYIAAALVVALRS